MQDETSLKAQLDAEITPQLQRRGRPYIVPAPFTVLIAVLSCNGKPLQAQVGGIEYDDLAAVINTAAELVQDWADGYSCVAHLSVGEMPGSRGVTVRLQFDFTKSERR